MDGGVRASTVHNRQEAQLMLTTGSTRLYSRSVEVKKHFESIPSKIKKNNSE